MDGFESTSLIFNKGLREETEHRPRQDSLHVEFSYRRTLGKANPNGLFKSVLSFSSKCVFQTKGSFFYLTKLVLASILILVILIFLCF